MKDQILDLNESTSLENAQYAGFWIRVLAYLIDGIILFVVQMIINLILIGSLINTQGFNGTASILATLVNLFIGILYFAVMESSDKKATLGKIALGIYVVDLNGNKISFGRAVGRYFAKILSSIILLIGFIMVGFTAKKQGLHDMIVGTYVVKK